ncbi:GTP 3',8-cyclase OS=Streptomyces tendae OX=1932 GN=moaA PE=3 SV=1 [Streptomyces tendae]
MPGLNDDEAPDLLAWAVEHDYELRFIEQMPLDAQHGWKREGMVTAGDILSSLRTRFELTAEGAGERGSAPAERWVVDGGPHRVGVIASVTRPFCSACDRTRLTADGRCAPACSPPRRPGAAASDAADEEDRRRIWRLAMWGKKAGAGLDDPAFVQPDRPMSAIGG